MSKNPNGYRRAVGVPSSLVDWFQIKFIATTLAVASVFLANPTYALMINVTYDTSVNSAPTSFKPAFQQAVDFFQTNFSNPSTVNINVGWGEVYGGSLRGALGASLSYVAFQSYSNLKNSLVTVGAPGSQSLPATSPVNGASYAITTAEAKALGLATAGGNSTDGYVGFSNTLPFTFDLTGGVAAGTYDFTAVAQHEISEVLGRLAFVGETIGGVANTYSAQDLFRFSSPGVRSFSASTPSYFSVDGGISNINDYNTVGGGDAGDWASSAGLDAFDAFSNSGVVNAFTASDFTMMEALGYTRTQTRTVPEPASIVLVGLGLAGLGISRRKSRSRNQ